MKYMLGTANSVSSAKSSCMNSSCTNQAPARSETQHAHRRSAGGEDSAAPQHTEAADPTASGASALRTVTSAEGAPNLLRRRLQHVVCVPPPVGGLRGRGRGGAARGAGRGRFSAASAIPRRAARASAHSRRRRTLKRGWCASARSSASARDGFGHSVVGTSSSCTAAIRRSERGSLTKLSFSLSFSFCFSGAASGGGSAGALPQQPRRWVWVSRAGPASSSELSELYESSLASLSLPAVRLQSSDGGRGGRSGLPAMRAPLYLGHCIAAGRCHLRRPRRHAIGRDVAR
jgi:hypothetical protein